MKSLLQTTRTRKHDRVKNALPTLQRSEKSQKVHDELLSSTLGATVIFPITRVDKYRFYPLTDPVGCSKRELSLEETISMPTALDLLSKASP